MKIDTGIIGGIIALIGIWLFGFLKAGYVSELFGMVLFIVGLSIGLRKVWKNRFLK